MSLLPLSDLLRHAQTEGYAVGYFEAWDSYSLEAIAAAAEAERSPVIVGFGCMLLEQAWLDQGGIEMLGAVGRRIAEQCTVPVSLLLNEAHTVEHALRGIDAGFNAVMICDSDIDRNARLVHAAHASGVAVEAELGVLPDGGPDGNVDLSHATLTDPDAAAAFVAATGVDALAVSCGNVHTLEGAQATIDFDRLAAIHASVGIPLVMHGGTGLPATAVPAAIDRGVAKFNVGTILKRTYLESLRTAISNAPSTLSPHDLIGSHNAHDLLEVSKAGLMEIVQVLIRRFGSNAQAEFAALSGASKGAA